MAVKGVDILIQVEDSQTPGTFITVGGQRGATLSESNDSFETTNKQSNGYKEYEYSFADWKISCDGVYITGDAGYKALVDAMRNKTKVNVQWSEGGSNTFSGSALVLSRDLEGPYDGESTYKLELQGSGAPTVNAGA